MKNTITDDINKTILEAKEKKLISVKDISDGHHTFGDLYKQRVILFSVICNSNPELAWKSKKHYNEEIDPMYEETFIAGIKTPLGDAVYHIKLDFWDEFNVQEIERAPLYDGHKSEEDLLRLKSLTRKNNYRK